MSADDKMTKAERAELASVIKGRANVAKADVDARKAELLAKFEEQLATEFKADDARWAAFIAAGMKAVSEANAAIAQAFEESGIPQRYAPSLAAHWNPRGENMVGARRAELRRVAMTRLDAQAKAAKVEIERAAVALRGDLAARALESGEAKEWLERLPTVEQLLPALNVADVEAEAIESGRPLTAIEAYRLGRNQ